MEQDIVGINEIAALAGVSSQAVVNWRSRATDFPRPIKELAAGPVFRSAQIRSLVATQQSKALRPAERSCVLRSSEKFPQRQRRVGELHRTCCRALGGIRDFR